jgi:DNA-binding NarL/FixJ family response regulator
MSGMSSDLETGAAEPTAQNQRGLRVVGATARVVIADSDAARRAGLLDEITQTMPEVTIFLEASTVAELLEHAVASRMAIIGGPLDDVPTSSLIRMLAQRFPDLHVIDMETPGQSPQ